MLEATTNEFIIKKNVPNFIYITSVIYIKKSFKPGLQHINVLAVLKISNIKHSKALDLYHYSENIGKKNKQGIYCLKLPTFLKKNI